MPDISIIIPFYNAGKYLDRCLQSVIRQSFQHWECIIVDDGSTDGSSSIAKIAVQGDRRLAYLYQENQGVSIARNNGIDSAQGEYICFVDADDWLDEDFLARLLEAGGGSDLIVSGQIREHPGTRRILIMPETTCDVPLEDSGAEDVLLLEKKFLFYAPHEKLFRTDIVRKNNLRFPAGCSYGEDLLFTFSYLNHIQRIRQVSYSGYHYRIGTGDTLSTIHRPHQFEEDYFQWNVISAFYRQKGLVTRESEKYHARRLWGIVYDGLFAYPKQEYKKGYIEKILDIPEIESLRDFQDEFNCSDWIKKAILRRDKLFFKFFFRLRK